MSGCIKYYNIYQLFIHVKLGLNIAVNNVLQVYELQCSMPFLQKKVRTPHALTGAGGSRTH